MRKRDPDSDVTLQIRAYFQNAALDTEYGRHLKTFLRKDGESEEVYRLRVNQFMHVGFGESAEPSSTSPKTMGEFMEEFEHRKPGNLPAEKLPMDALNAYIDELISLRGQFMEAAQHGNAGKLKAIIERGFPVNYTNPRNGLTALHLVAAYKARKALRVLLKTGQLDFLIRDWEGRLPSEIAFLYGKDPAVARLLGIKERKQAKAAGIKLTRRPK